MPTRARRKVLIDAIRDLYPPDTNETGRELFADSLVYIYRSSAWTNAPLKVLEVLHQSCVAEKALEVGPTPDLFDPEDEL